MAGSKSGGLLGSKRIARKKTRAAAVVADKATAKLRAVAYLRVSTEEQATNGLGLDSQEREVKAFATSQGYDLVRVVADAGVSGASDPAGRPGFAQVLELARARGFDVLLVKRFDRLARHIVYAVTTVQQLDAECGVALQSVSEPIETRTAMGRMIFAIFAGMAENEREVITDRLHGGRREKALKGGFAGGEAPFGYRKEGKGLVVVETEADTVRRIFELRPGRTLAQVAATLNTEGRKTRRGKRWWPSSVGYVLDNPKYRGVVEYAFERHGAAQHVLKRGKHKAIVA